MDGPNAKGTAKKNSFDPIIQIRRLIVNRMVWYDVNDLDHLGRLDFCKGIGPLQIFFCKWSGLSGWAGFLQRELSGAIFFCNITILILLGTESTLCATNMFWSANMSYIWPNFEGIPCNLDDVVHMNQGLPDEWRSLFPLTSKITFHLWDCSKDCTHHHSLHFVFPRNWEKMFFFVNANILKIPLTSESIPSS